MSQYGTTKDYCTGYDDGADETRDLYTPLVKASVALLKRWPTNKNLSEQIQALDRAVQKLPGHGRMHLDSTTRGI
jgi:hypothetical protein